MNRLAIVGLGLGLLSFSLSVTSHAQGGLTITSPTVNQRLAAGSDYATDVLGDPWDMSNADDISIDPAERAGWGADFGFSNGTVGGSTTTVNGGVVDTALFFLYRGRYDVINTHRSGRQFPIDPNVYKKLSFKMSGGVAGQIPFVYWYHKQWGEPGGDGVGNLIGAPTTVGYQIQVFDLTRAFGANEGGEPWTNGVVRGLRIDPNHSQAGQTVRFDWVRLTRADSDPQAARHTITWSGGSGTTTIAIIDADGTTYTIASGLSGESYDWYYGFLPPGNYTLRVTRGGSQVDRAFSINSPPVIAVTEPDATGGADFATTVLANAWDMNQSSDVERADNVTGATFTGGIYSATNTTGDAAVTFLYGFGNPRAIETSRYRYLSFRLQVDGAYDLGAGSVARVFWGSDAGRPDLQTTTKDILVWPPEAWRSGMHTYTVDLGALAIGTDQGIENRANAQTWTASNKYHFRIDPHEFPTPRQFHFDNVKLAAIDEASGTFTISWTGSDADDSAEGSTAPTVTLYYDADTSPGGRTQIATGLALSAGSYVWNTAAVTPGTYYIYAEVTDGLNTTGSYSTGAVRVSAPSGTPTYTLTVSVSGSGLVTSSPAGISCGADCTQDYDQDTAVALTPTAAGGSLFAGWSGNADCLDGSVTMSAARTCTANFVTILGYQATEGAVDLNGDAGGDAFRYNVTTGAWSMDFSDRAGRFFSRQGVWSPNWIVRAADFDGNGRTDFFLYNRTDGLWFKVLSDGLGGFIYYGGQWDPGWDTYIVDLDGNGRSDVFVYSPARGIWVTCISTGDGTRDFAYGVGTWSADWQIHPIDMNGDGRQDLFLYNPADGWAFRALSDGAGGFTYLGQRWSTGFRVFVGHFNADRLGDVFLYAGDGTWFIAMNTGSGYSYTTGRWDPDWTLHRGDYNVDGIQDIFLHRANTGHWFQALSDGAGNFTYVGGLWDPRVFEIFATDLNGDRRGDILLYDPANGDWFQLLTTTPGNFTVGSGNWGTGWTIVATR